MSITSVKSGSGGISLALDNNYMEPIATVLVGSGGINQITFSDIPQTYKHLQIRALVRDTSSNTDGNIYYFLNSDRGQSYPSHFLYGTGSSVLAGGNTASTVGGLGFRNTGGTSSANMFGVGILDILDYTNTTKYTTTRGLTGHDQNGSGFIFFWSSLWLNTDAVTSITFIPTAGSIAQYSRFSLYGIKG